MLVSRRASGLRRENHYHRDAGDPQYRNRLPDDGDGLRGRGDHLRDRHGDEDAYVPRRAQRAYGEHRCPDDCGERQRQALGPPRNTAATARWLARS